MTRINQSDDRVRRSVNPTNRVKARDSSGPVPLYLFNTGGMIINFSVGEKDE
jgi:hypothetical protein